MRTSVVATVLGVWLVGASPARAGGVPAEEKAAESRVVSVGLFKNGLAVVRREVTLPGPGTYRLGAMPDAVHGTFWVESDAKVEARVREREIDVPAPEAGEVPLQ